MKSLTYRQKILLNFLIVGDKKPMTRLQLMMALFLYERKKKPKDFYKFVRYLYGPCSLDVYSDLNLLEDGGFVIFYQADRERTLLFISSKGGKYRLRGKVNQSLEKIKALVLSRSFIELLDYIRARYPKFA